MRGRRTELPTPVRLDWEILRALAPYIAAYKGRATIAIVLLIGVKVATVGVPLVLRALVNALDPAENLVIAVPVGLLLAYGALRLSSTIFSEVQSLVFERAQRGIMRRLSGRVVRHLHNLSLRYHLERKTGQVASDLGRGTRSVSTLLSFLLFNILPTLVEVGLVTAILVSQYDPRYALVALVTVVLYVASTFAVTHWRMQLRTELNRIDSEANSQAVDGLLNYETVKYFGNEDFEIERYDARLLELEDIGVRSRFALALLNFLQGTLIAGGVTVIMFLAAQGVVNDELTIGDLVAVNAFLLQLFMPLGFLGMIYATLKHALNDMERMFGILQRDPEVKDLPDAPPLVVSQGVVRFEDVVFGYDPERTILHGISLNIDAGQKVAIVGSSGGGKSTLARLLFRFYDVNSGRVTIDGQDVRTVQQSTVRDAIGIVPQDTVLFNDTLGYNILYGNLNATEEQVREAARVAQLSDFIERLPKGYDTIVGERGLKLSGGEKQRVAIARAVLKNPAILVFDEATSSLDSESEQRILEALRALEGDRTTMVIAHRLSTIVDSDRIVVLAEGRIAEEGTHEQLLAKAGVYAHLWELQQAEATDNATPAPAPSR